MTNDLASYLLARFDEEEQEARQIPTNTEDEHGLSWWGEYGHLSIAPSRVLAEVAAKRRIVELHSRCEDVSYGDASTCPTMRALAQPYADRDDFNPEWSL